MARKSPKCVNARATRRSRSVQLSRAFSAKTVTHEALTRHRKPAQQSDLGSLQANDKRIFRTEVSPLLMLASLNAMKFAKSQRGIEVQTKTAHDTIMRDGTTKVVHSSRPGQDEDYFASSHHDDLPNLERKTKPMSRGEMEGGKDRKHLEGKTHKKKPAGRKNTSKSKNPEKPTGADNAAELAEPEEKRNDTEEPKYEVEEIVDHRTKNETEVELMVKWTGHSKPTLVDERTLQQDCPDVLYRYWKICGTRERATGIRLEFHAFKVLEWKVGAEKLLFRVQWVGYPPKDATWEFAWRVKGFAEEMHTKYLKTHPAARKTWEKEQNQAGLRNLLCDSQSHE